MSTDRDPAGGRVVSFKARSEILRQARNPQRWSDGLETAGVIAISAFSILMGALVGLLLFTLQQW